MQIAPGRYECAFWLAAVFMAAAVVAILRIGPVAAAGADGK
jgi:hypothetical protein